jgi:hypothetical protein
VTEKDRQILRQMRDEIARLARKIDGANGSSVLRNDKNSLVIGIASTAQTRTKIPPFAKLLWVKITGNATGGGKYNGKSYTHDGTSDVAATGNVSESELGTLASADDCLVLNFAEEGETTHDLTAGTPEIDTFLCHWYRTNSDGKKVCAVVAYDRETCS